MIVVDLPLMARVTYQDHENQTLKRIVTGAVGAGGASGTARRRPSFAYQTGHPGSPLFGRVVPRGGRVCRAEAPGVPRGRAGCAAPAARAMGGRLDRGRELDFLRACPGVTGDFWDNEATTSGAASVAPGEYLLSAN